MSADDDLPVPAAGARFTSGGKRPLEDASGSSLPTDVGHGIPRCEGICEACGDRYPLWFTENADWNLAVNRTQEHGDEWQYLCPTCFVRHHEIATGRVFAWKLTKE